MISSYGSSAYDVGQQYRQQRAYANASAMSAASTMSSSIFGADPSTDAAGALFGADATTSDGLFSITSELSQANSTISMAKFAWANPRATSGSVLDTLA
jgi:hypothetical protein